MKLAITNIPAFRAALACVSKDNSAHIFTGVHFEPNGTVAGTDGFRLAWHPNAVKPFEGEALTLGIYKTPPAGAYSIEIDTGAGTISWTTRGGTPGVGVCSLLTGAFPDFRRVTPTRGAPGRTAFSVNPRYLAELAKAVNLDKTKKEQDTSHWQFADGGGLVLLADDPELRVFIAPMRGGPGERLPVKDH